MLYITPESNMLDLIVSFCFFIGVSFLLVLRQSLSCQQETNIQPLFQEQYPILCMRLWNQELKDV